MVVNALGDIYDSANGQQIAGPRSPETGQPISTLALMQSLAQQEYAKHVQSNPSVGANTVIGVIATNAKLTKEEVNKLAQMAQDGIAMAVRPATRCSMGIPSLAFQPAWSPQILTSLQPMLLMWSPKRSSTPCVRHILLEICPVWLGNHLNNKSND